MKFVEDAAPDSRIIIGTEINLVKRLADKTVLPLHESFCPNMFKISPEKLLATIAPPGRNLVTVLVSKLDSRASLCKEKAEQVAGTRSHLNKVF